MGYIGHRYSTRNRIKNCPAILEVGHITLMQVVVKMGPHHTHGARVKLLKLAIQPFNGDMTNWTTFWDSFESAIDSSPGLTEIDKFNYLKSLLEKSAAEAIYPDC